MAGESTQSKALQRSVTAIDVASTQSKVLPRSGTAVDVASTYDGLRLIPGPLRLEAAGRAPCSPASAWTIEERGSNRWLQAEDGTRLALAGVVETRLCSGPRCFWCLGRSSRNLMRMGFCRDGFEPFEVVQSQSSLSAPAAALSAAVCAHAPELLRMAWFTPQLQATALACALLFGWLLVRRQRRLLARDLRAFARSHADVHAAARAVRKAWRSSRDASRPDHLVSTLRVGTHLAELRLLEPSGKILSAFDAGWLRLAEDHGSLVRSRRNAERPIHAPSRPRATTPACHHTHVHMKRCREGVSACLAHSPLGSPRPRPHTWSPRTNNEMLLTNIEMPLTNNPK